MEAYILAILSLLFVTGFVQRSACVTNPGCRQPATLRYNVKPEGSSTPCPDPCYSLNEYAVMSNFNFTCAETTLTLLPGEHRLNTTLSVVAAPRFAIVGSGASPSDSVLSVSRGANIYLENVTTILFDSFSVYSMDHGIDEVISVDQFQSTRLNNLLVSGQMHTLLDTHATSTSSSVTIQNTAFSGINMSNSVLLFIQRSKLTFSGNTVSNSAQIFSNFAYLTDTQLVLENENTFFNNSGDCNYALIYLDTSTLDFTGHSSFTQNSLLLISAYESNVTFNGSTTLSRNSACTGPLWALQGTAVNVHGSVVFDSNSASHFGGAIVLSRDTRLNVLQSSSLVFRNNSAGRQGGAIFVEDKDICDIVDTTPCFMQFPWQQSLNFSIVFDNNHAVLGGDDIYGGDVGNCDIENTDITGTLFNVLRNESFVRFEHKNGTLSSITSAPMEICFCEGSEISCCPSINFAGIPLCSLLRDLGTVYPGQNVALSVVAVGQTHGTVASEVRVLNTQNFIDTGISPLALEIGLENLNLIQTINATCTPIQYQINSLSSSMTFNLYPGGACNLGATLYLGVSINSSCPPGFELYESRVQCDCEQRLRVLQDIKCYIDNQTLQHDNRVWVGYSSPSGLIIHSTPCPFDYCRVGEEVSFALNDTDEQCSHNRVGLLCGECKEGLSVLLGGSSQCRECSNAYLALILPFALAGIVLIAAIFLLKMTVKYGTLSGIIFYANIVQVNKTLYFPGGQGNILTVIVAWLNLDFGINTCFYNGMDAYGRTWLQFVFPFYIWMIIGCIILASHFSSRVTNLLGSNPVAVLATLLLLSYVKILRTCIDALSATQLEYPQGSTVVWKLDGNIQYFTGKHIPLFLFAVAVLILLFLPYTLLLLFGQWVQHLSKWRVFSWTERYRRRLRPFLDVYHAPYKDCHRYWTGLLLLIRIILTGIALSVDEHLATITPIVTVILILQLWGWLSSGLYRKWVLDALEGSFLVNLGLLTFANQICDTNTEKPAVAYTSVSIALLTLLGVVCYHMYHQLSKVCSRLKPKWSAKRTPITDDSVSSPVQISKTISRTVVVLEERNTVSLREPLLEDNDA